MRRRTEAYYALEEVLGGTVSHVGQGSAYCRSTWRSPQCSGRANARPTPKQQLTRVRIFGARHFQIRSIWRRKCRYIRGVGILVLICRLFSNLRSPSPTPGIMPKSTNSKTFLTVDANAPITLRRTAMFIYLNLSHNLSSKEQEVRTAGSWFSGIILP